MLAQFFAAIRLAPAFFSKAAKSNWGHICYVHNCKEREEGKMKFSVLTFGAIAAAAVFASTAKAQNYPWCARINMGDEAVNCGFDSFEQCMTSLSGGGANGYCILNNTYKPPPPEVSAADTASAQTAVTPARKPQAHSTSLPATQGPRRNH
jgi:hypothetical protein